MLPVRLPYSRVLPYPLLVWKTEHALSAHLDHLKAAVFDPKSKMCRHVGYVLVVQEFYHLLPLLVGYGLAAAPTTIMKFLAAVSLEK